MKKTFLAGILLVGGIMQADVAVPPGGGLWQQTSGLSVVGEQLTGTLNNLGGSSAYWNNDTHDGDPGNCANIGCFVTKQSYFASASNSPNWSNPVYLGNDDGTAVSDFYFQGTQGDTEIKAEVAGLASTSWLGWYSTTSSDFGIIFRGSDTTGASSTFTPTVNYGLWFLSDYTGDDAGVAAALTGSSAKFTQSAKNAGTTNDKQYFSVFAETLATATTIPARYYVGIEDSDLATADNDFNDMVISLTVVPEPGFYGVLALGFVGLGLARRRRS